MEYTKDVFRYRIIPIGQKSILPDYGIDLDAAKIVSYDGKIAYELYPIGKIGLYAIADIRNAVINIIPAIYSITKFVNENNFGEQYDEDGFYKAMGAAIGSGSAVVGYLATSYFMRQKADYEFKKLAIQFIDSETKMHLGEVVFAENYRTHSIDTIMKFWEETQVYIKDIIDFLSYEHNNITAEQSYCVKEMRTSNKKYGSVREIVRVIRSNLVQIGVNPKDPAKEAISEFKSKLNNY